MITLDPDWTAPRDGQDWRDDDLLLAVAWFKSFVPRQDMERRIEEAKAYLMAARERSRHGESVPLFDPSDTAAWYVFQVETFATDRAHWTQEGVMRVVPFFKRIGLEMRRLLEVKGAESRATRVMLGERSQPDGGIFELVVALAYGRGGWHRVEFVPETPGFGRTPDLHVFRPRSRWAVECKRLVPSPYAVREKERGTKLAEPVHALCLELNESLVIEVIYKVELVDVPDNYLVPHVRSSIERKSSAPWDDEISTGRVRPINWPLTRKVIAKDDVYFGGSRMIELLAGQYHHSADHSMAAKWRPSPKRPSYAQAVYQASVVSWRSLSHAAVAQKTKHFRRVLAKAEGQLPADRPGVIHVGIESYAGAGVDSTRNLFNWIQTRLFRPESSRLRWVYGNYFVPEATTRRDESWAITETKVPYKIGSHNTREPLPRPLILSEKSRSGAHWDGYEE